MKYFLLFSYLALIITSLTNAQSIPSLVVENKKNYPVTLIVQLYFDQHEVFAYNWPLCNQIWNSYGVEQNTYKRGTYQPIRNVCFQSVIAGGQKESYESVNLPANLPHGFTVYVWDHRELPNGRLFIRKKISLGSFLQYPNDFFPQ